MKVTILTTAAALLLSSAASASTFSATLEGIVEGVTSGAPADLNDTFTLAFSGDTSVDAPQGIDIGTPGETLAVLGAQSESVALMQLSALSVQAGAFAANATNAVLAVLNDVKFEDTAFDAIFVGASLPDSELFFISSMDEDTLSTASLDAVLNLDLNDDDLFDSFATLDLLKTSQFGEHSIEAFDFTLTSFDVERPASPVPLPAGMPLLLGGLAAFGLLRQKK